MFTIVQFSPTGNTAYLANLLSGHLNTDKVYALEHTYATKLPSSDHLILLFSIHAFNAPRTVRRFVHELPSNRFKKVSLLAVGCTTNWINDAATKEIRSLLKDKSYEIAVDDVIAMPLTLITSFPRDLIRDQLETAQNRIKQLSSDIQRSVVYEKHIPIKAHVVNGIGRVEPLAARLFGLELHADKSCTSCGLCIRECPEKNIAMTKKDKLKFGLRCMMCLRCIYNCPSKSISPRISKFIPIKHGYSLKEYL